MVPTPVISSVRGAVPSELLPAFDLVSAHVEARWATIAAGGFDAANTDELLGPLALALDAGGIDVDPSELALTALKLARTAAWMRSFPTEAWSEAAVIFVRQCATLVYYLAHVVAIVAGSSAPCGVPLDVLSERAPTMTEEFERAFGLGETLMPEEVHFYRRLYAAGRLAPGIVAILRCAAPEVLPGEASA